MAASSWYRKRLRRSLAGGGRGWCGGGRHPRGGERGRLAAASASAPAANTQMDPGLYEALRLWRLAEAKGQSIPPYVIFHDSVLREIAAMRPPSLGELAQIRGGGAR